MTPSTTSSVGMASKEAADLALKGEVKPTSKEGHAIATFGGGCFWCVAPRSMCMCMRVYVCVGVSGCVCM
jgi:hypothetical protein